jgi:hypothetical protein
MCDLCVIAVTHIPSVYKLGTAWQADPRTVELLEMIRRLRWYLRDATFDREPGEDECAQRAEALLARYGIDRLADIGEQPLDSILNHP